MTNLRHWKTALAIFAACAVGAIAAPAQTPGSVPIFTTLHSFDDTDGENPYAALTQGTDGNYYGTTAYGGALLDGTVFRITPDGALTTLISFNKINGAYPAANLYGTTGNGGVAQFCTNQGGCGTVFKITPGGTLTTLYNFCSVSDCADGAYPAAPLMQADDGDFYGTAGNGGTGKTCMQKSGCGTIFKMTPGGTLTTLYSFCATGLKGCPDGSYPTAGLVQSIDRSFYGTTQDGGASPNCIYEPGCGTVFKMTPGGALTTLHVFCSDLHGINCTDGQSPYAGLIQGPNGNFYGTTYYGGDKHCGPTGLCGTIFSITADGTLTTLYNFCAKTDCLDGATPQAGLTLGSDGNLYGTTLFGGTFTSCSTGAGCGTIFQFTSHGKLSAVQNFDLRDGFVLYAGVMQGTDGEFYGTTLAGGAYCNTFYQQGCGTVYSLNMGLDPFVAFVRPYGRVGQVGGILGQGFTGTTGVALHGIPAEFKVVSDTYLTATIPHGATTGYVTVTTPTGVLTSNVPFRVFQ
jgi:uncharacterized repeat protein (TIGR03803 family)